MSTEQRPKTSRSHGRNGGAGAAGPDSIGRVVARLARQAEIGLSHVELSPAQYRILVQLAEGEEASSSLADKLAVSPPSITTVVEGLVQRGLVERTHSTNDRRRISLTLTPAGIEATAAADLAVDQRLRDIASDLGDDRAAGILGVIAIWREALDAHRARRVRERAEQAVAR